MRYILFVLLLWSVTAGAQQRKLKRESQKEENDTLVIDTGEKDSAKIFKPTIEDYRFFTQYSEKKIFDTAFTIDKSYIFTQYNNRDNFGKIQFSNAGSGFQPLMYELNTEQNLELLPTNKSFGILGINDIRYYDVKTPTTSFVYHNAMKNGGGLQSTYTQNVGKNFNFAIEYSGLRSQGFYLNSLASSNNTVFSAHYVSDNGKYEAFAHYLHQNVNNEENGGIADLSIFLSEEDEFKNRENLEVNLSYSDSRFSYRRYYFSHQFAPFNVERFPFKIKHTIYHQGNKYYYSQTATESFYENQSSIIDEMPLSSKKHSKNLSNTVTLLFDKEKFRLEAGVRYQNIQFGTNNIELPQNPYLPKTYNENRFGAVGKLEINLWNRFDLRSFAEFSNGGAFGNYIRLANHAVFEPFKDYKAEAFVNFQSAAPSFNYLLNHSPYLKFNYDFAGFENQTVTETGGKISIPYFDTSVFAKYYRIDKFAYFNENANPAQSGSSVNISQIGGDATFHYRKFHLNTKLLFQSTLTNKELFPAPAFIGRLNLYWQSKVFKDSAEFQAGIKTYYFSKFASRNYSPVLNEFILPDSTGYSIGGQPIADVYLNMKVKRMFFFIEGQHINNSIMQNESYTAPYYPIYDFRLNLGIVWYLFH
ncbi:MAG: hypothetical protein QM564_10675 [Bergeyella sp.]